MCQTWDDDCELQRSEKRKARRSHKCYACHERIVTGDMYVHTVQITEGNPHRYKHCLRCFAMFDALINRGAEAVAWDLNCGEVWEEPPDKIARLAFLTREEAQALDVDVDP